MSQTKFRIVPTNKLEDLNCFSRLNDMRQKVEQKFRILKNEEIYVQVPKEYVNSVLFTLFVKIDRLNKDRNNKLFEQKVKQNDQILIRQMFQKISKPSHPTLCKEGQFTKHVRINIETILTNQGLIHASKQVWDELARNEVSNPYEKAYFKFPGYPVPNSNEQIKRAFVVQFEETKDSCVLCFLETQKSFVKKEIDGIMQQAMTQKFEIKEVKQEVKHEKPIKEPVQIKPKKQEQLPKTPKKQKKTQKDDDQKSTETEKGDQEVNLKEVQKQLKKNRQKQEENSLNLAAIILLTLLFFGAFETWVQKDYYDSFNSGEMDEFTYSLTPSQLKTKKILNILAEDFNPLKEFLSDGYQGYMRPGVQYFCGVWEKVKAYPTVASGLQFLADGLIGALKNVKGWVDGLVGWINSRENEKMQQL